MFRRDEANMVKVKTFPPICKILELRIPGLDAERLGVREMVESYVINVSFINRLL